jgi:hypothetical protein
MLPVDLKIFFPRVIEALKTDKHMLLSKWIISLILISQSFNCTGILRKFNGTAYLMHFEFVSEKI